METFALIVAAVVLIGVAGYLVGTMIRHIQVERRSNNVRKIWSNFGLSIALATLFFVTWIAHAIVQWPVFAHEQREHGEPAQVDEYFLDFSRATLENWQSEFLQLFSFVVLAALLIHRGSAESKDGDERMEASLKRIEKRLDELSPSPD
jgi:Na+/phosphate symporter